MTLTVVENTTSIFAPGASLETIAAVLRCTWRDPCSVYVATLSIPVIAMYRYTFLIRKKGKINYNAF